MLFSVDFVSDLDRDTAGVAACFVGGRLADCFLDMLYGLPIEEADAVAVVNRLLSLYRSAGEAGELSLVVFHALDVIGRGVTVDACAVLAGRTVGISRADVVTILREGGSPLAEGRFVSVGG